MSHTTMSALKQLKRKVRILAIETSCDETGVALVEASGGLRAPKFKVLENLIASQIKIHRPFGGVVPNLAKREHIKNLPVLYKKLLTTHHSLLTKVDLIAVTVGPGLEPALWTGIEFAKALRKQLLPTRHSLLPKLVGANHMEGHLYSFLLPQKAKSKLQSPNIKNMFPAVALVVSGGHTMLLLLNDLTHWKKLGETRDDAVGEAFDKVARMLRLPYPGGPEIEKLSKKGDPHAINFPRPMMHTKDFDFSFSGLKTAVLYYLRDQGYSHSPIANSGRKKSLNPNGQTLMANVAASFQNAAIDVLIHKTKRAAETYGAKSLILAGGVAANTPLRTAIARLARELHIKHFVPPFAYNTDNAAMIAAAGYMAHMRGKKYRLVAKGDMNI